MTYLKRKQEEIYPYLGAIAASSYMLGKMGRNVDVMTVREAEKKIEKTLIQVYKHALKEGKKL